MTTRHRPLDKEEARAFLLDLIQLMVQIGQFKAEGVSVFEILLSAGFPEPTTRAIIRAAAKHHEAPDTPIKLPDEVQWIYNSLMAVEPLDVSLSSLQRLSRTLGSSLSIQIVT